MHTYINTSILYNIYNKLLNILIIYSIIAYTCMFIGYIYIYIYTHTYIRVKSYIYELVHEY
jgi:hypothetical protein